MRTRRFTYRTAILAGIHAAGCLAMPIAGENQHLSNTALSAISTPSLSADSLDIGSRLQLFVDEVLVDQRDGVAPALHRPVAREVALRFDAPWEGGESAYVTVFRDGERFRMYYRGGGESTREYTCLAESADGVHWVKPSLGLFEFRGSKENNIIWTAPERKAYGASHNFTPFRDTNPAARESERYKAVGLGHKLLADGEKLRGLAVFGSPDGIVWRPLAKDPVITEGAFDSQNVAFWDAAQQRYVCYLRMPRRGVRGIGRATSADFLHWAPTEPLDFGTTPLEHFYTNAIAPYLREPSVYLGFPMRFVPERKVIGADRRAIDGASDGVLISSRDGLRFERIFLEAFVPPGLDPLNWGHAHGNNTPAWGLVQTGETELSIYWCEHYGTIPRVRRGTLRLDGMASMHAPYAGGEFLTRPLVFAGSRLVINYGTSAVGRMQVEIQDATGRAFEGFALADCPEIYGDEIARTVEWNGGEDVSQFAGKPVRLRFAMKDVDLYSFRFRE